MSEIKEVEMPEVPVEKISRNTKLTLVGGGVVCTALGMAIATYGPKVIAKVKNLFNKDKATTETKVSEE